MEDFVQRHERMDVGAFLETGKESNVRFYRHYGFRVRGEHDYEGAKLWTMWRNASVNSPT